MATKERRTITIMPMVDGRKRPDLHHIDDVPMPLSDADLGRVMGDCMRRLAQDEIEPGANLVTLDVRFA